MRGHVNKPDHPWKKPLSPRKAAEDRVKKQEIERIRTESSVKAENKKGR